MSSLQSLTLSSSTVRMIPDILLHPFSVAVWAVGIVGTTLMPLRWWARLGLRVDDILTKSSDVDEYFGDTCNINQISHLIVAIRLRLLRINTLDGGRIQVAGSPHELERVPLTSVLLTRVMSIDR